MNASTYPPEIDLDLAGALEGTDKSSLAGAGRGYLRAYESAFAHLRAREFTLIEIGCATGAYKPARRAV